MGRFNVTRDAEGKPISIHTDNGFMQTSGPYREDEHGWTETQLSYHDFPAIQTGNDMRMLVDEVNHLRKQLWYKDKENTQWRNAAGFGPRP